MINTYFIRGTISVQVDESKSTIWFTPCAGFLTPDKQRVIAFPVPSSKEDIVDAKLIKWSNDKQFKFKVEAAVIKDNISSLLTIAAQQKPIELRLDESKPTGLKVTGFVFPAPSVHAHGR